MKHLLKALLLAGLFLFNCQAQELPAAKKVASTLCGGYAASGPEPTFTIPGNVTASACAEGSVSRYGGARLAEYNSGRKCPSKTVSTTVKTALYIQDYNGTTECFPNGLPFFLSVAFRYIGPIDTYECPPEGPAWVGFTKLETMPDGKKVCAEPIAPLNCSALNGMSVNSGDRMVADKGAYTKENPPSCATRCGTDDSGNKKCGSCKVIAKTWIYQGGTTKDTWSPMIGTFTGAACADSETTTPPPEPPKCWQTKNNLNMCQQDPAEKCITVNGAQQCQSGCGYINGDFFCADKPSTEPPKTPNPDKPLPEVDDAITTPEKPIDEMQKGDFKDVQKGVESRLSVVSAGIGNLENSVDESNQILSEIEENTESALADNQTQIGLLSGIKDALTGEGDGEGECDPEKDPNCANNGDAGTPASWWTSAYPQGMTGIIDDKRAQFQASAAYESMTQEINIGSGTVQPWQFCFNASSMNFGCFEVEIPSYVLQFVRLCILFGAAILCRRLLIGA